MIDYRQRLVTHQRNTFEGDAATYMVNEEIVRGRMAMGIHANKHFEIGMPLDAVVYNSQSHLLQATSEKNRLATILFTGDSNRNLSTLVNGKWVVKNGHHREGKTIKENFAKAMRELGNR